MLMRWLSHVVVVTYGGCHIMRWLSHVFVSHSGFVSHSVSVTLLYIAVVFLPWLLTTCRPYLCVEVVQQCIVCPTPRLVPDTSTTHLTAGCHACQGGGAPSSGDGHCGGNPHRCCTCWIPQLVDSRGPGRNRCASTFNRNNMVVASGRSQHVTHTEIHYADLLHNPHRTAFPQLAGKADTTKKTFGAAVAAQPDVRNGAAPAPPKPAFSQAVAAGLSQQQPPPQRAPAAAPAAAPPAAAAPPVQQSDMEARFAEIAAGPYLNFGVEDSVSAAQSPWGTPVQNLQLLNACASCVVVACCHTLCTIDMMTR